LLNKVHAIRKSGAISKCLSSTNQLDIRLVLYTRIQCKHFVQLHASAFKLLGWSELRVCHMYLAIILSV
jgi:hypothetical protein